MAGPTWYDSNYLYRAPIVVDGSATAAGTVDATITIPETHPFWLTVQSTGYDVRFTMNNGYTILDYNRATWTYASKVGIFEINAITHHVTNTMTVIWVYWGYAAASDGDTAPVISAALNAHLHVGGPVAPLFDMRFEDVGSTAPGQAFQKTANEVAGVTWRLPALAQRTIPWQGAMTLEGPRTLTAGGGPGPTPYLTENLRLFEAQGQLYLRSLISGGTTGNSYDAYVQAVTTEERTLRGTMVMSVNDL